jgi:hypothetical protein
MTDHPYTLSQQIAALLEKDTVAAGLVKEHISPERLRELLGIESQMTDTIEEALLACNADTSELLEYVGKTFEDEELWDKVPDSKLLRYVGARFTRAEVLRAIVEAA